MSVQIKAGISGHRRNLRAIPKLTSPTEVRQVSFLNEEVLFEYWLRQIVVRRRYELVAYVVTFYYAMAYRRIGRAERQDGGKARTAESVGSLDLLQQQLCVQEVLNHREGTTVPAADNSPTKERHTEDRGVSQEDEVRDEIRCFRTELSEALDARHQLELKAKTKGQGGRTVLEIFCGEPEKDECKDAAPSPRFSLIRWILSLRAELREPGQ